MRAILDQLNARLRATEASGNYRTLKEASGIDFSSNDYLGLSCHRDVYEALLDRLDIHNSGTSTVALGAPASRLLRGQTQSHQRLEERLASFKGSQCALLFNSGYMANLGVLASLIRPCDRVLSDELNHASIIDGIRLSGCATRHVFGHLDVRAIEAILATVHPRGQTYLVTESLFSMEGDIAPLDVYADLAQRYGAGLIVDDAHATGLYGDARRSGLCEHFGVSGQVLANVTTFGKALGVAGACVAGPAVVKDYLVNHARPFMFTTAPPPLLVHAIDGALDVLEAHPELAQRALDNAAELRSYLRDNGVNCLQSSGPIVPVLLGDSRQAVAIAQWLGEQGFDLRAVRPPTVRQGTARLRVSVHADHTQAQVRAVGQAIVAARRVVADRATA